MVMLNQKIKFEVAIAGEVKEYYEMYDVKKLFWLFAGFDEEYNIIGYSNTFSVARGGRDIVDYGQTANVMMVCFSFVQPASGLWFSGLSPRLRRGLFMFNPFGIISSIWKIELH